MGGKVAVKSSSQILTIGGMIDQEPQLLHSDKYHHIDVKDMPPANNCLLSWKTRIPLTGFHGLRIPHQLCQYFLHRAAE